VQALRQPVTLAGKPFEITISVGIAMSLAGETETPRCSVAPTRRCTRPNGAAATAISAPSRICQAARLPWRTTIQCLDPLTAVPSSQAPSALGCGAALPGRSPWLQATGSWPQCTAPSISDRWPAHPLAARKAAAAVASAMPASVEKSADL